MYGFDEIIDQQRPVRILKTFLSNHTIPHALLFTGIEGVGKSSTAVTFAMAGNCVKTAPKPSSQTFADSRPEGDAPRTADPCGVCRSCKKILANSHPDVIHIKPSGVFIRIAQIRKLCDTLTLKPFEARQRVVIIYDAHTMNPSAGNALLKMLEEPPDRTILVLMAPQATDLLSTIVSRCQLIRFNPIRRKSIREKLQAQGLADDKAQILAVLANGSLKRALEMMRAGWIQRRDGLLAASGLDADADVSPRNSRRALALAEALANDKNNVDDALTTVSYWLRDLLVCKFDPTRVVNKDLMGKIEKMTQTITADQLLDGIETIRQGQRKMAANANLRLTLEAMMLQLNDILGRIQGRRDAPLDSP